MRASLFALGLAALLSSPAAAALVNEGEWTLDTTTNLEWRHPQLTRGVEDPLGAGGLAGAGWNYASGDEFLALVTDYVGPAVGALPPIDLSADGNVVGYSTSYFLPVIQLIGALGGPTYAVSYNDPGAYRVHSTQYEQMSIWGILEVSPNQYAEGYLISDLWPTSAGAWAYGDSNGGVAQFEGSFLVREAPAPEISTMLMMLMGFVGLGYAGRRRAVI
jgi:hypothetical protein